MNPDPHFEPATAQPNPPAPAQKGGIKAWVRRALTHKSDPQDASRGEIMLYAIGNLEASIADQFFGILKSVMVVAMHVNPLIIGTILGIKSVWDAVTDPVMAYITDNTKSRWGRRRPYLLVGGIGRSAFLLIVVAFLPTGGHLTSNPVMEAQKFANDGCKEARDTHFFTIKALEQLPTVEGGAREKILARLQSTPDQAEAILEKITGSLKVLEGDVADRRRDLEIKQELVESIRREEANKSTLEAMLKDPLGMVESAQERLQRAVELLDKTITGRQQAVAAKVLAGHLLTSHGVVESTQLAEAAEAQKTAGRELAEIGLPAFDIFTLPAREAPTPSKKKGWLSSITEGFAAVQDPKNAEQRGLIYYVLIAFLVFTVFTTIQSVPYYALGIELCPSYNGRTQVVTYRAVLSKIIGLLTPWVPVLCFSLYFTNAMEGLVWIAVLSCIVGIPTTLLMVIFVRERTHKSVVKKQKAGLFKSMWAVANNVHFMKIFMLYWFIGLTNGIFQQIGFYLNVYWVMGSALSGAVLGAWVSMVAWALGFISLPIIQWACRRFQKHRVLGFAIVWMAIGTAIKWWAMNPAHPEFQFVLPFFFSVGIGSIFTVLPTMMADVTDVDELNHGQRREGMFGAVMAFLMKMIGTFTPILAGAVLVVAGFDPALEYEQDPDTIFNMRLMYSFIPAGMLLLALALVWRYPLTREKVQEIKEQLRLRHEAEEKNQGLA